MRDRLAHANLVEKSRQNYNKSASFREHAPRVVPAGSRISSSHHKELKSAEISERIEATIMKGGDSPRISPDLHLPLIVD